MNTVSRLSVLSSLSSGLSQSGRWKPFRRSLFTDLASLFCGVLLSTSVGISSSSAQDTLPPAGITAIPTTVPVSATPKLEQPRVVIEPLSEEQIDTFLDSIRSRNPFALTPPHTSDKIDPNLGSLWSGSTVTAQSDIREIVLRFRRRTEDLLAAANSSTYDPNQLLESFDITIDPSNRWLSYVHSHPERRQDVSGLQTRVDRPMLDTLSPFIRGQRESGVYYVIPPFEDTSKLWGVLVCPRRVVKAKLPGGLSGVGLEPSPYELSEVKFTSSAEAQVTMSTAGQKGRAQTLLKVSKGLPDSRFFVDTSVSTLPRAVIEYKPLMPADFFRFAPHSMVQEGLELEVEMTTKAGYRKVQHFGQAIYLRKFTEPPPTTVVAEGKRVVSDSGDCYIVMDFSYSWTTYSKVDASQIFPEN
jgi:hypothetical protein